MYSTERTNEQLIDAEKAREKEFISELKQKLDELEHYAAASGSLEGVPTSVTMEKQRVLIDQLRTKLDLQLDDDAVSKLSYVVFLSLFAKDVALGHSLCFPSAEELRKLVDQAIHQVRRWYTPRQDSQLASEREQGPCSKAALYVTDGSCTQKMGWKS